MILKYSDEYLSSIVELSKKCWSGEFKMSDALDDFIYNYLPRYYLSEPSLSVIDFDESFNGFFLVSYGKESETGRKYFDNKIQSLNEDDRKKALEYKKYLDDNHHRVLAHMEDNSLYLALLASRKKGTGSKLWKYVEEEARKKGIKHMYFWTDETCNYHYYDNKGYKMLESYIVKSYGRSIKTFIYRCDL